MLGCDNHLSPLPSLLKQGHIPRVVMGCKLARGKCILSLMLWRLLVAVGPEPKLVKATSSWTSADGCPFCRGPPGNKGSGQYPKIGHPDYHGAQSPGPVGRCISCCRPRRPLCFIPQTLAILTDKLPGLRGRMRQALECGHLRTQMSRSYDRSLLWESNVNHWPGMSNPHELCGLHCSLCAEGNHCVESHKCLN